MKQNRPNRRILITLCLLILIFACSRPAPLTVIVNETGGPVTLKIEFKDAMALQKFKNQIDPKGESHDWLQPRLVNNIDYLRTYYFFQSRRDNLHKDGPIPKIQIDSYTVNFHIPPDQTLCIRQPMLLHDYESTKDPSLRDMKSISFDSANAKYIIGLDKMPKILKEVETRVYEVRIGF